MERNSISFFWHSEDLLWCLADYVSLHVVLSSGLFFFCCVVADFPPARPQVVANFGNTELYSDRPRKLFVDKSNLSALCRVNRVCHLVFTPVMYRHITIADRLCRPGFTPLPLMGLLAESPFVTHTRTLTFNYGVRQEKALRHEAACRLLQRLPSLQRFDSFGVMLGASTVAALVNSCGRLSAVHIDFPVSEADTIDADRDDGWTTPISNQARRINRVNLEGVILSLCNLTGLKELCLDHMYGHPEQWIAPIAQVLVASRGLQKLQLSMSETAVRLHLTRRGADLTPFKTFLLGICTLFKALGASPLRLRSFRCGPGVHPDFPPCSAVAITDLICLDDLETIHLNTDIGIPDLLGPTALVAGADRHIPISTLLHDTPRLRRFSVSLYDELVQDALSTLDVDRARQLAVMWDVLRDETPALGPHSLVGISSVTRHHFRMFRISLPSLSGYDTAVNEAALAEARATLEGLVQGDDGSLEGLEVWLPREIFKVYIDLLVEFVPRLVGLTQLSLDNEDRGEGFGFWKEKAEMLAVAGGRLRFIAWQRLGFVEVVRGREGTAPLLVSMLPEEANDVELFGLRRRTPDFQ